MGLMTRMVRLCKSDLHGVMDQMEDRTLVLRQHLRELENALAQQSDRVAQLTRHLQKNRQDRQRYRSRCEGLDNDVQMSLAHGKEDIARQLIRKLQPLQQWCEELDQRGVDLETDLGQQTKRLEKQQLQYDRMRQRIEAHSTGHVARQQPLTGQSPGIHVPPPSDEEVELELLRRKEALKKGGLP